MFKTYLTCAIDYNICLQRYRYLVCALAPVMFKTYLTCAIDPMPSNRSVLSMCPCPCDVQDLLNMCHGLCGLPHVYVTYAICSVCPKCTYRHENCLRFVFRFLIVVKFLPPLPPPPPPPPKDSKKQNSNKQTKPEQFKKKNDGCKR